MKYFPQKLLHHTCGLRLYVISFTYPRLATNCYDMEGRCQCGTIRFITPLPEPSKIYVCHCTECRHQSSSYCGITAIFPWFEVPMVNSDGTVRIGTFTRRTLQGRQLECLFCLSCGSRLIHRTRGENSLSVKGGCLEALSREMMSKAVHIWCKEAVMEIPPGTECWEAEPED